jgi:hypothetical protein
MFYEHCMVKYGIHIGERIRFFVTNAPHGKGLSGFSKHIGRSSSVVHNMYKSDDIDFKIVMQACEYYGLTLSEFLGNDNLSTVTSGEMNTKISKHDSKLALVESKVYEILEIIKN